MRKGFGGCGDTTFPHSHPALMLPAPDYEASKAMNKFQLSRTCPLQGLFMQSFQLLCGGGMCFLACAEEETEAQGTQCLGKDSCGRAVTCAKISMGSACTWWGTGGQATVTSLQCGL